MIQLSNDGVIRSTLMDAYPGIIHGFTTRAFGNMNHKATRMAFMKDHHMNPDVSVSQEQIHGSIIHAITPDEFGTVVQQSDGILYKDNEKNIKHPILVVRVGDCVPLLFFEPKTRIIGVAHAGWKGTIGHITKEMIHAFIARGANISDIVVVMGPSICQNCYVVSGDVAVQFQKEFPNNNKILYTDGGKWYVDLIEANVEECNDLSIEKSHIDGNKQLCTFEKRDLFYSWRRKDEPFGEIMGYIGYSE